AGLRLFYLLLALSVLLPQLRLWFEREGWPDVAILVDDSRSMSATDRYQDPAVQEMVDKLAKTGGFSNPERLQLAQAFLTQRKGEWLGALLTKRRVKLHLYHFSGRPARIADVTEPQDLDAAAQTIGELR